MKYLCKFQFDGQDMRVVLDPSNEVSDLWFVAKDICDILSVSPESATQGLKADDKMYVDLSQFDLSTKSLVVSDFGVARILDQLGSDKAQGVFRMITKTVMPSVFRHMDDPSAVGLPIFESSGTDTSTGKDAPDQSGCSVENRLQLLDILDESNQFMSLERATLIISQYAEEIEMEEDFLTWLLFNGYFEIELENCQLVPTKETRKKGWFVTSRTVIPVESMNRKFVVGTKYELTSEGQAFFLGHFYQRWKKKQAKQDQQAEVTD